jgi:hypothetical protein
VGVRGLQNGPQLLPEAEQTQGGPVSAGPTLLRPLPLGHPELNEASS